MFNSVYDLARQLNGVCTWDLNQAGSGTSVGFWLGFNSMSQSFSADWIKHHAYDDHLVNTLGGVKGWSGAYIPFNVHAYLRIKSRQDEWSKSGDWEKYYQRWLSLNGLKVLSWGKNKGKEFGYARLELAKINGAYASILLSYSSMRRPNERVADAHSMAAWVGAPTFNQLQQDALFFDPNFGEFWFQDREHFFLFFNILLTRYYRPKFGYDSCLIDRVWKSSSCR
ncbi:YopT-type cysteine protease domain-containing protein [Microbulbifer sp. JMSA003]|uniref:YopT-type cysteine protease domain-containing protein n=1 Tax=Microbulbifer sp. JMSA003 TaxID=3243369 RepID=UPI004039ADED